MSLTPAHDERAIREKKEKVELCGKNRGPHNWIEIESIKTIETHRVTRLMCLTCFSNVSIKSLLENYPDVSY